jgi:hypothetical protein
MALLETLLRAVAAAVAAPLMMGLRVARKLMAEMVVPVQRRLFLAHL